MIGIWKAPVISTFPGFHFYPYFWGFIQNSIFWLILSFAILFVWITAKSNVPFALLPTYVVGLAWARIQLELQMAIAAKGSIFAYAQIDPFSYAQITAYFAMRNYENFLRSLEERILINSRYFEIVLRAI